MSEDEARRLLDRLGQMVSDRPVPLARLLTEAGRSRRRRRRALIGVAAAAATVVVGAGAVALGSTPATRATDPGATNTDRTPSPTAAPSPTACPSGLKYAPDFGEPLASRPPFPTNANGQTYGSDAGVNDPLKSGPELAAVVGDCGKAGFVYETELMGSRPTSPADALRIQKEQEAHPQVLPVYEVDGSTQIDTFTISSGTSSTSTEPPSTPQSNPGATADLLGTWTIDTMVRFLIGKTPPDAFGDAYSPEQDVSVTFTDTTWQIKQGCATLSGTYTLRDGGFAHGRRVDSSGSACINAGGDFTDVANAATLLQQTTLVEVTTAAVDFIGPDAIGLLSIRR